jgi:hypothetical protein
MASQQRRRRGLPQPNTDAKCDRDSNTDSNGYTFSHGYSDDASRIAYAYANRDGDNYTEGSANAKAAAHAVSTAYAVTASE